MPRNNKNKNRNRGQAQSAGGAAKSASTIGPNELEQKAAIISAGIEAAENTKSALSEAKDKLDQLQETVNSIQVNIIQSKEKSAKLVEETKPKDPATPDAISEERKSDSADGPFETQTMRKRRNRNRNKKKNGQSTGDSGVSSTDGTHESSPNVAATIIDAATSIAKISKDELKPSAVAVAIPEINKEIKKQEQLPKKSKESTVKLQDVESKALEKPKEKTDDSDALSVFEEATIEEIKPNINETLLTNSDALKTAEIPAKDAIKLPKANKKQNQKGSAPPTKSDEPKKFDQEDKSMEERDILKERANVESTKSEETMKALPADNGSSSRNDSLSKPIGILEPNRKVEELIGAESKIEQPKLVILQAQPTESSGTKNQSAKETKNAKNNKKAQNDQKNQQKPEPKSDLQPKTKQEGKKDLKKTKQQPENVQNTSSTNVIQEPSKITERKTSEELAELKATEDKTIEVEKPKDIIKSDEMVTTKEEKIDAIDKPNEGEPVSPAIVKEEPPQDSGTKNEEKIDTSISSSSLDGNSRKILSSTPTAMIPAPETPKSVKTPVRTKDETAEIWKILEEASKSLEPVEIQMEDAQANSPLKEEEPPSSITGSSIAITPSDEIEAKKAAHNLMVLLDAKEPTIVTKSKDTKSEDSKSAAPKKKEQSPIKSQPRQPCEPIKKDTKSHSKHVKAEPKQSNIEAPPPIVEHTSVADTEIPLDMSIISDTNIETSEIETNSKNVQGSDFVPSVEQTAAEMKSLGNENVTIECEPLTDTGNEAKKPAPVGEAAKTVNSSKQPPPKCVQNASKASKAKFTNLPPKGKTSEQCNQKKNEASVNKTTEEKAECNANATGKKTPPQQKSGKPNFPPKPDHLISSNSHDSQKMAAKKGNQHEMKLRLNGAAEDGDDFEESYIEYKFMPRQVFIATLCLSCKKSTTSDARIHCENCQMVSYCCKEHQATDNALHKDFCAAIQEIAKKRGGHVYNNARILNNNDYRSLRVHTLNLCEEILKRPLQTYEREMLLFPRLCSMQACREWRQNQLTDCPNCKQVYYCTSSPDHLNETHQRWCKSVALYGKLVVTQSISGRIEPSLPSRILSKPYTLPNNIEEIFEDLYKNYSAIKDDCVFATVTQLATAPLTAYFAAQKSELKIGEKFTIHLVGAELQFEADILDIWETFFLHLSHKLVELTIVFCGPELNAENIPLDIISRIRMCRTCRQSCRIVKFDFQCAKLYHDYAKSSAYQKPDLICFFNPGFHHVSYNGMDTWPETIKYAANACCPVLITSYTEYESPRDLERFKMELANIDRPMTLIHGPQLNAYSSQRPERNFISDEVTPLIFKNFFCFIMK